MSLNLVGDERDVIEKTRKIFIYKPFNFILCIYLFTFLVVICRVSQWFLTFVSTLEVIPVLIKNWKEKNKKRSFLSSGVHKDMGHYSLCETRTCYQWEIGSTLRNFDVSYYIGLDVSKRVSVKVVWLGCESGCSGFQKKWKCNHLVTYTQV